MQNAVSTATRVESGWKSAITSRARIEAPTIPEWCAALATSILLILSFPNFDLFPLAWLSLAPLLVVIARRPAPARAFILGGVAGTVFFYGSCYWLTYSMIQYGGLSPWIAYLLLVPGVLIVGLFPALFALGLGLAVKRWGPAAILLAPFFWTSLEWARLGVTGQLWNAIGYSQAYHPLLIQSARWGGVYAVGFLIVFVNAAISFAVVKKTRRAILAAAAIAVCVAAIAAGSLLIFNQPKHSGVPPFLSIIALQPNVPMNPIKTQQETQQLIERHLSMSSMALHSLGNDPLPRLVIWPESPMNFTYAADSQFQDLVARFTRDNHTSLLLNSQEPATGNGFYNSAVLINEEGRLISQYDKIRLLPFGEYVPLPRWLPGASLITAIVGDFTPGDRYALMAVGGRLRAGVFICIESAYPFIARRFTSEGADVLINISNDGYLGPTAVMRQHLGNAIFRAVENGRPLLRVTNSGITAFISANGEVRDQTRGFEPAVRTWTVNVSSNTDTFYTRHGDVFAGFCASFSLVVFVFTWRKLRRDFEGIR
jgi:apolipoprotein N-acyltransferase